jgi:hypothetical protein
MPTRPVFITVHAIIAAPGKEITEERAVPVDAIAYIRPGTAYAGRARAIIHVKESTGAPFCHYVTETMAEVVALANGETDYQVSGIGPDDERPAIARPPVEVEPFYLPVPPNVLDRIGMHVPLPALVYDTQDQMTSATTYTRDGTGYRTAPTSNGVLPSLVFDANGVSPTGRYVLVEHITTAQARERD